jgi:hypothetical protein
MHHYVRKLEFAFADLIVRFLASGYKCFFRPWLMEKFDVFSPRYENVANKSYSEQSLVNRAFELRPVFVRDRYSSFPDKDLIVLYF